VTCFGRSLRRDEETLANGNVSIKKRCAGLTFFTAYSTDDVDHPVPKMFPAGCSGDVDLPFTGWPAG
jgi:hypothetical protein